MKLAFLALLLANLVLFAWQRGVFGPALETGREPQRISRQIAPERVLPLTSDRLARLQDMTGAAADRNNTRSGCVEFGDFDDISRLRAQARLDALGLGDRLQARRVEGLNGFTVYLPLPAARGEAERIAQDLRSRGIRNVVLLHEGSPLGSALALGSFRDQDAAQRRQAELGRRGLQGLRISESPLNIEATRFEIREVDAQMARQLAEISKEFPLSWLGACAN
jgi:hypothetical protein